MNITVDDELHENCQLVPVFAPITVIVVPDAPLTNGTQGPLILLGLSFEAGNQVHLAGQSFATFPEFKEFLTKIEQTALSRWPIEQQTTVENNETQNDNNA